MFELHTIKDIIEVPPALMLPCTLEEFDTTCEKTSPFIVVMKHCISKKYVGKVVPSKGYCIAIQSVVKCSTPAVVHNGEGSGWCSVIFTAILFRPFEGEKLKAFIERQTPEGIRLTTRFFDEIFIPAASLIAPSSFDAAQSLWFLEIDDEENGGASERNYYRNGDEVVLSVASVKVASESVAAKLPNAAVVPGSADRTFGKEQPIMMVVGSFLGTGLGPTAWYGS